MRTLKFTVNKNGDIWRDPHCDFSHIKPGTKEPIQLYFSFHPDWDKYIKVVGFWNRNREECKPQLLKADNTCIVPKEALKDFIFYIEILGKHGYDRRNTERRSIVLDGR